LYLSYIVEYKVDTIKHEPLPDAFSLVTGWRTFVYLHFVLYLKNQCLLRKVEGLCPMKPWQPCWSMII